jgi:signal transduction histidine kinase
VVAAHPPIASTVSFSDFAAVSAVLNGQPFAVSRYRRPLEPLNPTTIAAAPVRDAAGNVTGALVITINLTGPNIRMFTHPIGLGETGYMDLVDLRGVILASTRPELIGRESDHGESLVGMIREHRQSVSACHDCHAASAGPQPRREVLAFAPLDRAQWGVTVRQSEDEAFAPTRLLQVRIFALMVVMLAGALTLVYLTTRSVITPVQALTTATRRIAAGDLDTPLETRGQDEIGALARSFDAMRARLKDSIAEIHAWNRALDARVQDRTAALAVAAEENARLYAELQHKEQLRSELLHRVISAQEEERKRISRELHDETCQVLTGLAYALDNAAETTTAREIQPLLEQMHALTETALDEIHRVIRELRPTMLDHLGLIPALRWYAETRLGGPGIRFRIRVIGDARRLPPPIETTLFRVVQEAINNIARHSHAGHADFVFEFADHNIEVHITDDGIGFDAAGVMGAPDGRRGLGLMGMEERISTAGGEFHLRSAPGKGTTIRLSVPLKDQENVEDSRLNRG